MIIAIICFGTMMVLAHFLEREADKIGVFLGPFIGMMIVAAMTSIPELAVVMNSVIKGSVELAVGTIIGSNIANIALVLGIAAIFRPIEIEKGFLKALLALSVIAIGLIVIFFNLKIIPPTFESINVSEMSILPQEGIIMMIFFGFYIFFSKFLYRKKQEETEEKTGNLRNSIIISILLALIIWFLAEATVVSVTKISAFYGISQLVIGVVILAVGTSLPELGITLVGVIKRNYEFVFVDLVGSNAFDIAICLGIASLIIPIAIIPEVIYFHIPFLIFVNVLVLLLVARSIITRRSGAILLLVYASYIALTFIGFDKISNIFSVISSFI